MELDKSGQPIKDPASETKQPEADVVVDTTKHALGDGTEVTLDELKSGYMRQSDYTKKTQDLSEKKKDLELSDDDKNAIEVLKKAGFAMTDELAQFKKEQAEKEEYSSFAWAADLSETQLKMVADLKTISPDKSYADIANEYWLIDEAKLNRVKGSMGIKGKSFALPEKEEPYKVDVTKSGYNPEQAATVAKMRF